MQLDTHGFSLTDRFIDNTILDQLRVEALEEYEEGRFKPAAIGRGLVKNQIEEIRGDRVKWLDTKVATKAQTTYWEVMDELRVYLSNYFRIHLERTEVHFAVYPKGAFYAKHLDQFQGASNRIFSVILYLNDQWVEGHGGELRVYNSNGLFTDYAPLMGRLVIFRSDAVEHEVLVANQARISLTGWMRRDPLLV